MADTVLAVHNLSAGYDDAIVLEDVSFTLERGQGLALLGRNGMGKTTLIASLMGLTRLRGGSISLNGKDVTRLPPHRRAHLGLGWVPQEREIFPSLSVEENLTAIDVGGSWTVEKVWALFPRLYERRANGGNQLSGGEQQMLAIARALMLDPQVLLLDEPMEGLAPIIVRDLFAVIRAMIEEHKMTVILVEQHAHQILPLTDKALVLDRGRTAFWGDSADLLSQPERLESWLGVTDRASTTR
jgi:branched-chain amino acid transport system ATP-binding protein